MNGLESIRDGIQFIDVDGLSIRLSRGGRAEGIPIVLTSPWPESIYAFRDVWTDLSSHARLIAFDLPGFGRSEGRTEVFSVPAMAEFVVKVITQLGLSRVHAVGPDVGTSAWLLAAVRHPDLIQSIVVGSGLVDLPSATGALKSRIEAPNLDAYKGGDGGDLAVASVTRLARNLPPPEVLEDYRQSSAGERYLEASAYVRSYPGDLPVLEQKLKDVHCPVLVISGKDDPLVPPSNGEYLKLRLPNCRAEVVTAGHLVWEDDPQTYARLISSWITLS